MESEAMDPAPREMGPRRLANAADPPGTFPGAPRRGGILVVDDEASVRSLLNTVLRDQGFGVWLAVDGEEALTLYRRHRAAIDVVLLDVRLPGLDGPQILAALQALNPQIGCCFISGDLGEHSEESLRNLGATAVLAKPFRVAEIAQVVRELIAHAALGPCRG